ncbi:peptidase M19, partial [bacterium]
TIADLQKMEDLLAKRGFSAVDVQHILCGNWVRFLRRLWG